ncbi:hypothetical protein HBH98_206090 [Parastagonospora nodorum]|nr:hypothetical protein HBH53_197790 [Parastagonospora nodorum]KAH3966802.1 hypothetical protein HBH52_194380 [Parastagonospora nodorum]KAH4018319.1 hypothetical protein HBI09_192810 [Parastagonospora nodorum]KAH4046781.1 hypothetical protein HBH49_180480 [Parastagonospora nodorum]KAH4076204.1 hypothetical protein HBH50_001950 [Parastagonospora nodorum]
MKLCRELLPHALARKECFCLSVAMAPRHADGASLASDNVVLLPEETSTDRGWAYSSALSTLTLRMWIPGWLLECHRFARCVGNTKWDN